MNLRHLEMFYSVMLFGSLTEAASALCISQPAASKLLKHAEQRLGFALFKRVKGKLQPTKEAYILYDEIKPIYDKISELNKLTYNLAKNPQGQITLGCLPSLGLSLIPKLTAQFLKKYPGVFVNIGTDHTLALEQKLLQREIDIAVTFQPQTLHGIIATPILEIPLVYIDSEPVHANQDIHSIDENRWIQPDSNSLMQVVSKYRTFTNSIVNVQTYYMASELVRQGLGCSITDIYTAAYSLPKDMIHPIKPRLYTTIYILRNANVSTAKAAEDFIELIKAEIGLITPAIN
ncbi:LysR family transcriptional regulator [Acinetobacter sp. ANC 5054]|uniref:LysR family transcriptional regulator n=1 Tax=Acinetobacter sp. ANC 5054 TaxID=1977877 RepID=UPI000A351191|nr:LysR family transcriptional regulator [Acinetobacter sp. ANC 5054]OTG76453.1 LysR family transcriptional regulator [Acinetobacter sp. ANC 5054]